MTVRLGVRRSSESNWDTVDPTLADGELGYESDTGSLKVGDGTTPWSSLTYSYVAEIDIADSGSALLGTTNTNFGGQLAVTDNNGTAQVDGGPDVQDGGTTIVTRANTLNFGTSLPVTDQGGGKAKVDYQSTIVRDYIISGDSVSVIEGDIVAIDGYYDIFSIDGVLLLGGSIVGWSGGGFGFRIVIGGNTIIDTVSPVRGNQDGGDDYTSVSVPPAHAPPGTTMYLDAREGGGGAAIGFRVFYRDL